MRTMKQVICCLSVLSIASTGYAEEDMEVETLQRQVDELKIIVEQLSRQQNQNQAVITTITAKQQATAIKPATTMTLSDGQTQAKFYGSVRVDAAYDLGTYTNGINNKTGSVALDKTHPTEKGLAVSAAASRIGVDLVKPLSSGDLTAKLEADFWTGASNSSGSLRIRHAYFTLDQWLFGQTTSPFVNTDTAPDLIDFTGPMGTGTLRNVQLRYIQPINANQKLLVALEGGDIENDAKTAGGSRFPAFTLRYDVKTADQKGLLQLHGLLHENRVSSAANNGVEKMGWGLGLGAKYELSPLDVVMANYYHIKGDNRYLLYADQNNSSYHSQMDADGKYNMELSEFDALQLGYQRKWKTQLRSAFSLAALQYKDDGIYAVNHPDYNKTLFNAITNLIYSPAKSIDLGLEYTYGKRKTFAGDEGKLSRVNFLARYNF